MCHLEYEDFDPFICKIMSLFNKISNLFHSHLARMYQDYPNELGMAPH